MLAVHVADSLRLELGLHYACSRLLGHLDYGGGARSAGNLFVEHGQPGLGGDRRHFERQVDPVELGDDCAVLLYLELLGQVLHDFARGGSGQGQHAFVGVGQRAVELDDAQLVGAEGMAPLADAVRFVDSQQVDFHVCDQGQERLVYQALGSHEQYFGHAVTHPVFHRPRLILL